MPKISGKSELAKAIRYALARMRKLRPYLEHGCLEADNNAAERALRGVAIGRKSWLFAGSDRGGERAAAVYSLIVTARLNDVDPRAWLANVLRRIADQPISRLADLLPWNWRKPPDRRAAAA